MSEQFENIDTLIVRSLEDSLSPSEQTMLQTWLDEDATHRRYFDEIRRTWTITGEHDTHFIPDTEANWQRFRESMYTNDAPELKIVSKRNMYLRIAASITGIAVATMLYFTLRGPNEITELTAANEKKTISLPDGSKVYMNQHSRLRYDKQLAGAERAIHLEGEAFFEVANEPGRPFVVYANETQTQVLGTSFDVRAYAATPVEVAVVTGKVAVSHDVHKLVVTPGRKVTFAAGKQPKEDANNDANFIAWKENRFVFDGMQIRDVIKTLSGYYGVKIIVTDESIDTLHLERLSPETTSLTEIMNQISFITNSNWTKEGNTYRIYRK
ncbi:FecR family protein [Chitinophaga sancti]|uniref:FecR domain-containing protein n=1 Tax=Chitinophaga sancti TaxID=1004 RepID=A0A1K1SB89_9BACT|nr:FecR domain-containing protein [Chitinophaga sancti]WQD60864.1 FecR domain-containing protein [Chitinophaga sancti]WQG87008.1 FecR domain-containing protein [Chitinophaga sancti]SFW81311.1 FecR family protein [Chitinophaga sancti]